MIQFSCTKLNRFAFWCSHSMASLRDKIGQLMMVGLQGEELTQDEKQLLKNYPFGGFILFSHNLKEPEQILSLCRSLWEISREDPPFIAIDQEGGRVHRLPEPFTHFPAAVLLVEREIPTLLTESAWQRPGNWRLQVSTSTSHRF